MPYLIPSRTPLVSEQVERAFAHVPCRWAVGPESVCIVPCL